LSEKNDIKTLFCLMFWVSSLNKMTTNDILSS